MSTLVSAGTAARQLARHRAGYAVVSLGIDPGPGGGLVLGGWKPGEREAALALAWQGTAAEAPGQLALILGQYGLIITCGQIEEFRTGIGPGARGRHATATRGAIGVLVSLAAEHGVRLAVRHSSQVMPWASDRKLKAAGLYAATTGKKHSRAAARHCAYAACHDGGLPDPLSSRWERA
jgi:hypothetical protein